MGPVPSYSICLLGEYFSHLHISNLPGPEGRNVPPDTSDGPPTFQNCSENPGADVILTEPSLLRGPHGLGPPFSVFLPTLTELTTVFQGRVLWNGFQDPAGTAVLPLLFWAEVLCELEEQGSRTDTDMTWVPPCVLRACSHAALRIPAVT